MTKKVVCFLGMGLLAGGFLAGCGQHSYPKAHLKEALAEICRTEYGIENIKVKVVGDTIGVYMPLPRLFATDDFRGAVTMGRVRNLESLFEPSPEALEKVEDVLFSISRVLLSTDEPLRFYILQATDVEQTGLELILTGYVDDIKRVRLWDIPRSEYRKRIIHELRLNRAVQWHRPVRRFFKDLDSMPLQELQEKYFGHSLGIDYRFLFKSLLGMPPDLKIGPWEILEIRSTKADRNNVFVYVKIRPKGWNRSFEGIPAPKLEYLFIVSLNGGAERHIVKIIPFQFLDATGRIERVPFPKELRLEDNLKDWETEFEVKDIDLGPFLADQLTRRVQSEVAGDERIQNTFRNIRLNFEYHSEEEGPPPYFSLNLDASLRDYDPYSMESVIFHEDMLYLLTLASREFVEVMRSYRFGKYQYLSLNVAQEPTPWILGRENLELFRRNKVDLANLLSLTQV